MTLLSKTETDLARLMRLDISRHPGAMISYPLADGTRVNEPYFQLTYQISENDRFGPTEKVAAVLLNSILNQFLTHFEAITGSADPKDWEDKDTIDYLTYGWLDVERFVEDEEDVDNGSGPEDIKQVLGWLFCFGFLSMVDSEIFQVHLNLPHLLHCFEMFDAKWQEDHAYKNN